MASSTAKPSEKAAPSDTKTEQQPEVAKKSAAALEEDDEFEDFPVEGTATPESIHSRIFSRLGALLLTQAEQTGLRRRPKLHRAMEPRDTCGRRAGMTMTQATTSLRNSG
jgi:hypothetical protein